MDVTPRRVVLTGATGFIGSHVAALLLRDPAWQVRVVGRRASTRRTDCHSVGRP
ncbi:NAD-dependent epimerase/dehydratase family protein [Kitasatospora sp. NPDC058444]|uniref:NAD-dependent epimerase/dehydratase family protein n=1 Tax=Kitasatospora sp. NPDC058444 TaxID=3346504 RepID=UPI0036479A44